MKKKQNLTHANLREVCPCHSMFKIREITEKIGFQFCKLTFSGLSELFANLFKYKKNTKVSFGIKFIKGLLTSYVLDSLTSMIECS